MSVSIAIIEAVPQKCGTNAPGLSAVQFIKSDLVLFIPSPLNGVISNNIIIAAGEGTVGWEPTKGTAIFTEERKTNEDFGDFYELKLSFDLPKVDQLKFRQHINLANIRLSAVVTDENGITYFLHRLKHRSKSTTGNTGQRNGYEWEFLTESKTPAYIFTGTLAPLT